ncbi:unnamed protein product [Durusdinium trenchii]|uniref:Uncharacterized protein n=2 Tax=Durusdinium trenchii TaxID=1381693 RepID=A0ABP0IQ59_9DINO
MILPYIQQRVDESEFHGARELLALLKRELAIRSSLKDGEGHPDVQRTPRTIAHVLQRMSLGNLIALVCGKEVRGHLVIEAAEAYQILRAEVKYLVRAAVCKI